MSMLLKLTCACCQAIPKWCALRLAALMSASCMTMLPGELCLQQCSALRLDRDLKLHQSTDSH